MKKLFNLLLLVGLLLAGGWAWNFFFPSVEQVLRARMTLLAATATFGEKTNPITRAAKAQKLIALFSPDVQIALNGEGYGGRNLSGRDELSETAGAAFAGLRAFKVEFLDLSVHPAADRQSAEVNCTVRIFLGESKDYGVQEMRFQFRKQEGNWLIVRVESVKTLS